MATKYCFVRPGLSRPCQTAVVMAFRSGAALVRVCADSWGKQVPLRHMTLQERPDQVQTVVVVCLAIRLFVVFFL